MKINILSDLHIEFHAYEPETTDADVVILAGDIGVGLSGIRWASHAFPGKEIIYVLGNHEYYRQKRQSLLQQARAEARRSGIHLLENDEVVIQGTRFLGSTLWTDFELFGGEAKARCLQIAAMRLSDFHIIRENETELFTPEVSLELHVSSVAWLAYKLDVESFDGPTVVVTHHAPHQKSVAEKYKDDLLSACYASKLERLMGSSALWIHGHTHTNFDYEVKGTRIVCNPRGYASSPSSIENAGFNPGLTIEIF